MKNLKKLISVIIAVIMLVSSFATVAAADYADVESTDSYYKAIKVLSGLGIAKGDEAGNFNPTNDVKRSEMVAFVCRMMGEDDIANAASTDAFTDVAANHWAAGYIAWGVNNGIINGMGDGTFAPDAPVKYQDAVVMIMRALGYDRIAQRAENGGYPTGYLKVASQNGVLSGAGYDNAKAATREIIAQLIYNGLTAPLVAVSEYGVSVEDDKYTIYNGKGKDGELRTMLTYTNEVYKVKVEIVGTPKSDAANCIDKDGNYLVAIDLTNADGYDYKDAAVDAVAEAINANSDDVGYVYVGETEAADLLGYTVEAYIVEDEDLGDYKLLAVVADNKSVVSETLEAEVEDYTTTGTGSNVIGVVSYFANENDRKATEIEIDGDAYTLYFNGSEIAIDDFDGEAWDGDLEALLMAADSITFMGPKNSEYNKIFVTKYKYAIVDEVVAEDKYIIAAESIDGIYDLDLDAESRGEEAFIYNLYDGEGNVIDFADIEEGDVLNIVAPFGDIEDVLYIDVYVTNDSVEGVITEKRGRSDPYTYIIDGEEYDSLTSVDTGDEGIFYLTIDGKIVKKDAASTVAKNFAFLVGIEPDTDFGKNSYTVRLFTADGLVDLNVASTFKTNVAYTPDDEGTDGIDEEAWALDNDLVTYKADKNGQDPIFATGKYLDKLLTDTKDADTEDEAKATLDERFFTYKVNAAGDLSEIRFAKDGSDLEVAKGLDLANPQEYLADFASLDDYDVADAPIFVVLVEGTADNFAINTDKLAIASFDTIEDETTLKATSFKLANEDALAAVLAVDKVDLGLGKAPLAVVKAIGETLDAKGDRTEALTLLQGGETITVVLDADESFVTDIGDIILYALNAEDEVGELEVIYDYSENALTTDAADYTEDDEDMYFIYAAVIREKDGSFRFIKEFNADGTYASANAERYLLANADGATYAIIDRAIVASAINPATGIKAVSISGLKGTVKSGTIYTAVAKVGETGRIEDMIEIIFDNSADGNDYTDVDNTNWVIAD